MREASYNLSIPMVIVNVETPHMKLRNRRSKKGSIPTKLLYGFLIAVVFQVAYKTIARGGENSTDTSSSGAGQIISEVIPTNELSNQLLPTPKCQNTQQQQQGGSYKKRWSDRLPSRHTSTVQSLFNCDLPSATCQYYFPANFFDKGCGIGRNFAHYVTDAEAMRVNDTLWNNMPSVGFPTITMNNLCLDINGDPSGGGKKRVRSRETTRGVEPATLRNIGEHILPSEELRCLTERVSFIHVHKSGGTSLHRSFDHLNAQTNGTITRHKWFTPIRVRPNQRPQKSNPNTEQMRTKNKDVKTRLFNYTLTSALQSTTYPTTEFGADDHVIFAVVRDPTERFISSIGQAMGGEGSTSNLIGKTLQKECIKATSALTLACMARYVRDHGFWIELHFAPQVIDISFTTIWQDIPVAVFPFTELKRVLTYLGLPKVQGRHGAEGKYRPDPVLSNMTVDDYNEESLRTVCEIYKVDVVMQRSLGIEVPRCDPFIPH